VGLEVEATRTVPASPDEVFAFLSDLGNHWRLADRWIEVLSLERPPDADARADRGRVRMRGPLGMSRIAATRVLEAEPSASMAGSAELSGGTRALVSWTLIARDGATDVTLAAGVERAGAVDRLLLAVGGRAWLARRFDSVLERLADRFAAAGPGKGVGGAVSAKEVSR
jgi:uncharacterized protein YndB with AHSA1/START domain